MNIGMERQIGPEQIQAKRQNYFYPCTQHFYQNPPQIVRGLMQYVYDDRDKEYTDFFAGVSVVACGHCNPAITEATIRQLQTLQHTSTIYLTQPNVELAERLADILPGGLRRTFFVNSGTEANEGAMLLARMHTGRKGFIALEHSLHGRSHLTMSVTGLSMWRADPYLDPDVTFIPRPFAGAGQSIDAHAQAAEASLIALERVLETQGHAIAAMIIEPVQGNGGMIVSPDGYFQRVKRLLDLYGVLLIADEIQTGFGRTGRMFAMQHFGVVADIVTMAKALGNGVPIAAFATTDRIAASLNRPSASTFGGNPVSAVTALAVLDYINNEKLAERSIERGGQLKRGLEQCMHMYPSIISDVRGMGLMIGVEIAAEEPERGAMLVDRILEDMKDLGFIIGKNGVDRNVLAFQPPLIIGPDNIRLMLHALDEVLSNL